MANAPTVPSQRLDAATRYCQVGPRRRPQKGRKEKVADDSSIHANAHMLLEEKKLAWRKATATSQPESREPSL